MTTLAGDGAADRAGPGILLLDGPIICAAVQLAAAGLTREGWRIAREPDEVTRLLAEPGRPNTVAVARSLPVIDDHAWAAWPEAWPGVRFLHLLGPWCEGEARTGKPIAGYERVFWDEVVTNPSPDLRPTSRSLRSPPRQVLVASRNRETMEAIAAALDATIEAGGLWVVPYDEQNAVRPSGPVVAEVTQLNGAEASRLAALRSRMSSDQPLTVLIDFPRPETRRAALEIGVTTVLRKPYSLASLVRSLGLGDVIVNRPCLAA